MGRSRSRWERASGWRRSESTDDSILALVESVDVTDVGCGEVVSLLPRNVLEVVVHDGVGIVSSHVVRLCTLIDFEVVVERGSSDATVTIVSLVLMVESENVHQLVHHCSSSVVEKAGWIKFHSGLHISSRSSEQPTTRLTSDVGEATFELIVLVDLEVVSVGGSSWSESDAGDILERIHSR